MATSDDLARAIAQYEGYYSAGTVAQRNNNPGNLRSWGSYPVVGGFVQFPTAEVGWAALRSQIQKNIARGLTLEEFFGGKPGTYAGYAPAADNNAPRTYAATVANWLGISADVPLTAAIGGGGNGQQETAGGVDYAGMVGGSFAGPGVVEAAAVIGLVSLGWLILGPRG